MTEVTTRSESSQPNYSGWSDATAAEGLASEPVGGGICRVDGASDEGTDGELSAAVSHLVSLNRSGASVSGTVPVPDPSTDGGAAQTNNNAQRTRVADAEVLHTQAGVTSGGDSFYAGVAGVKGRDRDNHVDIASASVQLGAQNEVQAGVARVGVSTNAGSWEVHILDAELHGGVYNPDGSLGANAGFSGNLVAAEGTLESSGNSLTLGLSAGVSAEASLGVRNADGDAEAEYCVRVGYGPVVAGACVEPANATETVTQFYEDVIDGVARWVE